jgi:hypothetical protein
VVEFSRSGQEKTEQRPGPEKKTGIFEMTFTGTLIEDLMATVERVEKRARADRALVGDASALEPRLVEPRLVEPAVVQPMLVQPMLVQPMLVQPWLTTVQENADYDSKFFGVA